MPKVSRSILEVLREDQEFVLSRVLRHDERVLLLAPASEHPSPETIARLEYAYSLREELDPAWAARPLELTHHDGRPALLMEDPGGELLERRLGQPIELHEFLRIAVGLAVALGSLHARGLIHRDVKPANILVDRTAAKAWLCGFHLASRLPRQRQAPGPPEEIAGTLAYMAPEQTGRMNRSIDSRSDLYAYGVVLYEMLTGTLPFVASDPMELVHCHIARQPMPPSEREQLPAPVSAIVMRLLAKIAEERYQTARGVEADLRACLAAWESSGVIGPFVLGTHDVPDQLLIPERLYGREREVGTLLAAFDRVMASGRPELVLVAGYSGIGKSSVVHELHKALVPSRGFFASGKFDQYKRHIPYATLAQAFEILVRQILSKSDVEIRRWRDLLQEAVGTNGQLIINLIGELELVIGEQPPVPDLPPHEAQNRFNMVFGRFLGVFARPEHPLALFLDDLQWVDVATLQLLGHLITEPDLRHLLLVGAFRDNEVGRSHPLVGMLEELAKAGVTPQKIALGPLSSRDIDQLLVDSLHCAPERVNPLGQLIYEKTGGNPFFAIQFFRALAEEGLLVFNPDSAAWSWDLARIHAKGFTDEVGDLMVTKLSRLPAATQEALKELACLGNSATIRSLTIVRQESEEALHTALWEAVRSGFLFRLNGVYKFLHDRIQEAAYALVPDTLRAGLHLRIGRQLIEKMTTDEVAENIFDIVNQLNSGIPLISDLAEKERVAELNLWAGRKAKRSTAYGSACLYLSVAAEQVESTIWDRRYELAFALWLERAECEYLQGNFDKSEALITELLSRAESKIDKAAAYRLKIPLHIIRDEYWQAVDTGLECLRVLGIEIPAHPSREEVQNEYESIWQNLRELSIESLVERPVMVDPEMQAAMEILSEIRAPANNTDINLHYFITCRMVNLSVRHGTTDASTHGYAGLATILGPVFNRYLDGYRFGKLACNLVEKYGFHAYKAKAYLIMEVVMLWTQPISKAIELARLAFRAGVETGDLSFACYSCNHIITDLLAQGAHLDEVWRESQKCLEFDRKIKFRDAADIIVGQQRFIQNMRGHTAMFSSFSDPEFDEAAFESQLTEDRMTSMIFYYWTLKLEARFMSGDYDAAMQAAQRARALLWSAEIHFQSVNYHYYNALTIAAVPKTAGRKRGVDGLKTIKQSLLRLREWSENCPETFVDKYSLVAAEVARLENNDLEAMRMYEKAIRLARENAFVQHEGIGNELAGRFCLHRGFEKIAHYYLRDARACYLRWGASGKVKQLEQDYPEIAEQVSVRSPTTISTPFAQLDLESVVRASHAVSSEIVLEKLIETLMVIAVEDAGAERGLLILPYGEEHRIEAEGRTSREKVEVELRRVPVTPSDLPESLLRYVIRTQESVILDDASAENLFSQDTYIRQRHPRSVLCLPLVKQATLVGVLYLENNLTPYVFTPARIAVLELLASQAAISLENARLYAHLQQENAQRKRVEGELRRSEGFLAEGQKISHTGSWGWNVSTGKLVWSEEHWRIFEFDPKDVEPTFQLFVERVHPEDRSYVQEILEDAIRKRSGFNFEFRIVLPNGSTKWIQGVGRPIFNEAGGVDDYIGTGMDITDRKRAEEELRRSEASLREAQTELAHVARLTTMGEIAASLAHEVNQPLGAIANNAHACLRLLATGCENPQNVEGALQDIVTGVDRVNSIIVQMRALAKKLPPELAGLRLEDVVSDVLTLVRHELTRRHVIIQRELPNDLPTVLGDRVQLQQVLLNLVMNGVEAMDAVADAERKIFIRARRDAHQGGSAVLVSVQDSGVGLKHAEIDRLFEAFYTTKANGIGMGLAISRSIVEAHGGRLWVVSSDGSGATFQFILPVKS
jgi:predicted ATPase/signal transduction histidine kinase/GAF domain-containing protein